MLQTAGAKRGTDPDVLEALQMKQQTEGKAQLDRVRTESEKLLADARETRQFLAVKGVSKMLCVAVEKLKDSTRLVLDAFSTVFTHPDVGSKIVTQFEDTRNLEIRMGSVADILNGVETMVNDVNVHLQPIFIPSLAKQTIYELQLRMDSSLHMVRSILDTISRLNSEIVCNRNAKRV
mmetsp:Transcript_39583/g.74314  ORF Transcript_39583/g.74314 Transcript_39583/m.74314 type:complete len:178 (+) Transcript_39583:635-1168(+)